MPLTEFQRKTALLLSRNRSEDSYLAGAAALHFKPDSIRYSQDLDYFHDSEKRVATAFEADQKILLESGYKISVEIMQPGYLRCVVNKNKDYTKIEWAHDSAWRFMPSLYSSDFGYTLHPSDLVINKTLALAGRDEPRDFLDVIYTHEEILPLGAQCWAACGKDPGFSPQSLLEILKRRGKYHEEDFSRLKLTVKVELNELKNKWLKALAESENFIKRAPINSLGCLFYSTQKKEFIQPTFKEPKDEVVFHFGRSKGILPRIKE